MGDIEEASKAKVTTQAAATHYDPPPGYWEEYQRKHRLRKKWLLTIPGRWWQAKRNEREGAMNALLERLKDLGVGFDPDEIGIIGDQPDAPRLARCSGCDAKGIEDCKACGLWPVIDGG